MENDKVLFGKNLVQAIKIKASLIKNWFGFGNNLVWFGNNQIWFDANNELSERSALSVLYNIDSNKAVNRADNKCKTQIFHCDCIASK